jgi:hypothetical protein
MNVAPRWTEVQLTTESAKSRQNFIEERTKEPLQRWIEEFSRFEGEFQRLFDEFGLAAPSSLTPQAIAEIFREKLGPALRYVAGPPISADDLKELADASLAPTVLAKNSDQAKRVLEVLLLALDPKRFPWLAENRSPTDEEKLTAITASAALITAQRVSTDRRNEGKDRQEAAVKSFLKGWHFLRSQRGPSTPWTTRRQGVNFAQNPLSALAKQTCSCVYLTAA